MSTPQNPNFGELLYKTILPKVLLIALLVSAIGLALHFLNSSGAADILMIGLSTLAGACFVSAFAPVALPADSGHSPYSLILYKLVYISAAVTVIGILFSVLRLEGYKEMMMIGCGALGIAVLISAALVGTNSDNMAILKRPLIIGVPLFLAGGYFLYQASII
ncbi:MAG: hypothetical protein KIT62_17485 [Cyclobacteriaceae bacterium]|nr:hypothetical protein [Cyclobacteriaceae bacterium]